MNSFLPSEENIPFMPAHEAERLAAEIVAGGSRFIKVRVGAPSFHYGLDRLSAVWKVINQSGFRNEIVFSVDANQGWNVKDAIRNINKLAEHSVTIVEQPVRFNSPLRLIELIR